MKYLRVKNFEELQHYKDRTPPWIKLYNSLLDDYEFACLQDASKLHLIGIWLLASRTSNKIPADSQWIANKINATEKVDLEALLETGFIEEIQQVQSPEHDASTMQANGLPRDRGRGRERGRVRAPSKTTIPKDFGISDRVQQWAEAKGYTRLHEHLEAFKLKAKAKGYKYSDWDAAFMEAVRKNWAGLESTTSEFDPRDYAL